ncbi:HtaA domain-containing protein [Miltoncostaea marina]|uniref:HtaA domain-containing protein n=1 Tax=Miltoncostaea marina TaxID=2843215 RepID=UPI001C3D3697|nr:HtaA domain-containing protein [Miltoncostaea marina]
MRPPTTTRAPRAALLVLVVVVAVALAAACGGGEDGDEAGPATAAPATTSATAPATTAPAPRLGPDAPEVVLPTGGTTTLTIADELSRTLSDSLITLLPFAPATAGDAGIAFPIGGGSLLADRPAGDVHHLGGLVFVRGDTELVMTALVLDADGRQVTAIAGGGVLPLLDLDLASVRTSGDAREVTFAGIGARLTAEGAIALNGVFGVNAFRAGLPVGALTIRALV